MQPNTFPLYSLSPKDEARLTASGIDAQRIKNRGYYTETTAAALGRKGFSRDQRQAPGLVIPTWGPDGRRDFCQFRPHRPRLRKGREVKYENPYGAKLILDIHPDVRDKVLEPETPLLITEGIFKGDAAASRGLACIAALSVNGWEGDLDTWGVVPLRDRLVRLAFDSDVQVNVHVHRAVKKLAEFLKKKGAKVEFILFPQAEDGSKVGLDDYFASGKTVEELFALAVAELPPIAPSEADRSAYAVRYESTDEGFFRVTEAKDGETRTQLSNFTARIVGELVFVEDPLRPREFEIEVKLRGKTDLINVLADEFGLMNWVISHLGGEAIISPGFGIKDEVRAAIQIHSGTIPKRPTYARLGWVNLDGRWGYLHAGGVVFADFEAGNSTPSGNRNHATSDATEGSGEPTPKTPIPEGQAEDPGVRVRLSRTLSKYRLTRPDSRGQLIDAIRLSLAFLDRAPDRVTVPLYAYLWRVAVDTVRFSVFLVGSTGTGKTELTSLIVQHFGQEMDAENIVETFGSTTNSMAAVGHDAMHSIVLFDDFVTTGSLWRNQLAHDQLDTLLRGMGNRAGRNRCTRDGSTIGGKEPRCGYICTGEVAPHGQSLGARYLLTELEKGDVFDDHDPTKDRALRQYQALAKAGVLNLAMTGFLQWLASRYDDERESMHGQKLRYRDDVFRGKSSHRRVVDIAADLLAGFEVFLRFALDIGAIDVEEVDRLWDRAQDALFEALGHQEQQQVEQDPARRFIQLLVTALNTGRAHLVSLIDEYPDDRFGSLEIWGYREERRRVPVVDRKRSRGDASTPDGPPSEEKTKSGGDASTPDGPPSEEKTKSGGDASTPDDPQFEEKTFLIPRGEQMGWRHQDNIFLDPARAFGVAQKIAAEAGQPPLPLTEKAMGKRLRDSGMLASSEKDRNTLKIKKPINGVRMEVWHISAHSFYEFFRSWASWADDRDEEALRDHEDFVRREEERQRLRQIRAEAARRFMQEQFMKLLESHPRSPRPGKAVEETGPPKVRDETKGEQSSDRIAGPDDDQHRGDGTPR